MAQRGAAVVEIHEKNMEIERPWIPEWDADFVVFLGAADLIRRGHLGEVREQLHERVEGVLVPLISPRTGVLPATAV
jgi:hypothetical protein